MTMRVQASPVAETPNAAREARALGPALGIVNGCVIGLGCWAGLLWLAFG